jgi:hypothetical protein
MKKTSSNWKRYEIESAIKKLRRARENRRHEIESSIKKSRRAARECTERLISGGIECLRSSN